MVGEERQKEREGPSRRTKRKDIVSRLMSIDWVVVRARAGTRTQPRAHTTTTTTHARVFIDWACVY